MNQPLQHTTVLLDEAVHALLGEGDAPAGTFVDGTFGRGGHSRLILQRLGPQGRLVLPLTTAVTHVVMVRAGKLSVGVPAITQWPRAAPVRLCRSSRLRWVLRAGRKVNISRKIFRCMTTPLMSATSMISADMPTIQ